MAQRLPGAGNALGGVGKAMGQMAGKAPLTMPLKSMPTQMMPKPQSFAPTQVLPKPQAAIPPTDIWRPTAPTTSMPRSNGLNAFDPENVIDSDFIERILAGTF